MRDEDLSALERAVLSGDRSALFKLRVAYWRLGPPERSLPEGGIRFCQGSPLIVQKPDPDTSRATRDVFSVRARNALARSIAMHGGYTRGGMLSDITLREIAERVTELDLRHQPFCGPKTIAEIRGVLELAGLELTERKPIDLHHVPNRGFHPALQEEFERQSREHASTHLEALVSIAERPCENCQPGLDGSPAERCSSQHHARAVLSQTGLIALSPLPPPRDTDMRTLPTPRPWPPESAADPRP